VVGDVDENDKGTLDQIRNVGTHGSEMGWTQNAAEVKEIDINH